MKRRFLRRWAPVIVLLLVGLAWAEGESAPDWDFHAKIIEACSCPMFCQCYFNTKPAEHTGNAGHEGHDHGGGHGGGHFCRFNNAFRVDSGKYGDVKLDGAKFWVAGDLGGDWSKGQTDWAVVTFDKSLSPEQREAIGTILGKIYNVKWGSLTTAEGNIDKWTYDENSAHATLDGGKTAEVKLKRMPGMTDDPVVIHNLKYWDAPRNDGFVLMPNEVEAYRVGDKPFEFKGTNGFMITLHASSKDFASGS